MLSNLFQPQHGKTLAIYIIVLIIIWAVSLAILHPTSSGFKKRLTMVTAFLAGSYYLAEFLMPATWRMFGRTYTNPLTPSLEPVANAQQIWLALAIGLGIVNLFRVNGRLVMRRRPGWHNGLIFFFGFFAMLTFGMLDYYKPGRPQVHGWYLVLFNGAFNALSATSFSLLAFYIISAAYRSFRVRSAEAILLLISALIMMLGLTPLGTYFITGAIPLNSPWAFLKLENISEWILMVLNGAAQRALLFGIAVGLLATSLRFWLSLERGQFFDAEM